MVKCSECGFLAGRNKTTRELEEVEEQFRSSGDQPKVDYMYGNMGVLKQEPLPVCFDRSIDIHGEIKALWGSIRQEFPEGGKKLTEPDWKAYVRITLSSERQCESFTKWHQGFTPKEHQEMIDRERRDIFENEIRRNDRKWHQIELAIVIVGNIFAAGFGALIVWFVSNPPVK